MQYVHRKIILDKYWKSFVVDLLKNTEDFHCMIMYVEDMLIVCDKCILMKLFKRNKLYII